MGALFYLPNNKLKSPLVKAAWLRGYSGRLRTERSWVRNLHMLPPLVSQGDVVIPCKPELGLATLGQGEGPWASGEGHIYLVRLVQ